MEGTIAVITFFAGNFAPRAWAFCQGQIMSISQNTALFSLLGTTYGGNGQTTFALPDLRGRSIVGPGQGPGLGDIVLGEFAGTEQTTLLLTQLPQHTHTVPTGTLSAIDVKAAQQNPTAGAFLARGVDGNASGTALPRMYVPAGTAGTSYDLGGLTIAGTIGMNGGNQPFASRNPYNGINSIICLEGIYPSRN